MESQSPWIEQLKPLLKEENFDELFAQACRDLDRSERFLLKMELGRLNQESRQVIDLRERSLEPCRLVKLAGVAHFLPPAAEALLKEQVTLFGGRHTVGAVEAVLAQARKLSEQASSKDEPAFHVATQKLGHHCTRRDSRRTFSTEIRFWQGADVPMPGLTLDLSVGGCQIRLDAGPDPDPDEPLLVSFPDLAREHHAPLLAQGIPYKVLSMSARKGYRYLRLKRQTISEEALVSFNRCLQASWLRTTPEINHLLTTTQSRGYERHYLLNQTALTLLYKLDNAELQPIFGLLSPRNEGVMVPWRDELGRLQLATAMQTQRLTRMLREPHNCDHQLLYQFVHTQNGQRLMFSATLAELKASGLTDSFLRAGAERGNLKAYRLGAQALTKADLRKATHCAVTGQEVSKVVGQQLSHLCVAVTVEALPLAVDDYLTRPEGDPNALRRFGMRRLAADPTQYFHLKLQENRREHRFALSTQIVLSLGDTTLLGTTVDVSPRGLKLKLDDPQALAEGTPVSVALPKLQPLAGKLKLNALPYELVRCGTDARTLHLKADESGQHSGVLFLSRLLHGKANRLEVVGDNQLQRQLRDGLVTLALKRLPNLPLFVHQRGGLFHLDTLGTTPAGHPLLARLLAKNGSAEPLSWLLAQPQLTAMVSSLCREQSQSSAVDQQWLISLPAARHSAKVMVDRPEDTEVQKVAFIDSALRNGGFLALHLQLYPTGKPDLNYLEKELAIISTYALHRAKELKAMMWQVKASGQLTDVTELVLERYGLSAEAQQAH